MRRGRTALAVLSMAAAVGCSTLPNEPPTQGADRAVQCERLFQRLDAAVDRAGVRDGGVARIDAFPQLRANRFLASFRRETMSRAQEVFWIDLLRDLDAEARALELANLPEHERAGIDWDVLGGDGIANGLRRCGEALVVRDFQKAASLAALRESVEVPDEYQDWQRVLGLYPLTALPFLQGVSAYQAEREAVFATPLGDLPIKGRLVRYEPPPGTVLRAEALRKTLARARRNPLQIPLPSAEELTRLFATFAPTLEIDQVGPADEIGKPWLNQAGEPGVDVSEPVVLLRAAHTRYGDEIYLQLVYSFWFPERPPSHPFDLLAGRLDGITWRVTLDGEGQPVLYDSIHNCGCYHLFITTGNLRLREVTESLEEPVFVASRLASWRSGDRVVLRIAAGTHYIQNVRYQSGPRDAGARRYSFAPDDALRSLNDEDRPGYSLFRSDGIVPGTQRRERFLFWPMGVASPGAMRQWGRHATAFVGKRHFDDARLIERYFEMP